MKSLLNKKPVVKCVALGLATAIGFGNSLAQDLNGAGSTFINPIMQTWIAKYREATGISINYQSIGSGGGITALINHTVDFAATDAPMNPAELTKAGKPVLHIPVVAGAVTVCYNVAGVQSGLKLTGPIVADIYLENITYWDAPQIKALNPGVNLPHDRIFVTHRSDGSGTSYIFTDYLCKISPEWKQRVGMGKSVRWPVGLGGKGNEGVAGLVRSHPSSIGYVELAYATQNNISTCVIRNAKGKFIAPSAESASLASAGVQMPADMRVSITNTNNPNGYPISGFVWLLVYQNSNRAQQVKSFLDWVISTGQSDCAALQYASIPTALRDKLRTMISTVN